MQILEPTLYKLSCCWHLHAQRRMGPNPVGTLHAQNKDLRLLLLP